METLTVEVKVGDRTLHRNYGIVDGQAPENMQENIQSMVDTLLDEEEI